jgi:DNA-binding IclR family transcriptional regulator
LDLSKPEVSVQSVEAAFDVLECFLHLDSETLGGTQISRETGLSMNRTFRLLNTLVKRGYIEKDSETKRYRLGARSLILGEAFRRRLNLSKYAEPILEELAEESGDAAHLLVIFEHQAITVDIRLGEHMVQAAGKVGELVPFNVGASPKVLLAYLAEPEQAEILDDIEFVSYTPMTITRREELQQELEVIKSQGYCSVGDDYEVGVHAIAAPVFDHQGRVVGGISLTIPHARFNKQREEELIDLVTRSAKRLSGRLGLRVEEYVKIATGDLIVD